MDAYKAGFLAGRRPPSVIDRLRQDWQWQQPYSHNGRESRLYAKGTLDGRRSAGRGTPCQEYLIEQFRRIPVSPELFAIMHKEALQAPDWLVRIQAHAYRDAIDKLPRLFAMRETHLDTIPEFNGWSSETRIVMPEPGGEVDGWGYF